MSPKVQNKTPKWPKPKEQEPKTAQVKLLLVVVAVAVGPLPIRRRPQVLSVTSGCQRAL